VDLIYTDIRCARDPLSGWEQGVVTPISTALRVTISCKCGGCRCGMGVAYLVYDMY